MRDCQKVNVFWYEVATNFQGTYVLRMCNNDENTCLRPVLHKERCKAKPLLAWRADMSGRKQEAGTARRLACASKAVHGVLCFW